ncbi:probable protein phosphatase 2C 51 isoform X2 [Daucus carota subsp. sativus]|uniref:probable protein phosphatase 2C 51 isoform X2 n=1 Tax=Daucus carota subsp. sativus TaxID=79200 RepID=UPI00308335BC
MLLECNRPTSLMMVVAFLGVLVYALTVMAQEVSVSCMMAYDEGGAPAVFQSLECPQWDFPAKILQNQTDNCQFATIQGYRDYQEDRVTCNLDFKIPVLGKNGPKEIVVGVLAIFDGHGGKEASEMASKYLLDYFLLHVIFCTYKQSILLQNKHESVSQGRNNTENDILTLTSSQEVLPLTDDLPIYKILKEALLGAIRDIDMKFSLEALDNNYVSGSTATVVLLLDGTFLVANIGDSKALLCSFEDHPVKLWANELTNDHHPSRDDEKARIEAAGGFVRVWGVPRVNGVLAVSRSIGDIYLKRYGVIATPEVRDWDSLKTRDMYLVVASDGIFETLTSQDVCELLEETEASDNLSLSSSSLSLADRIVYSALRKGSMDNLSAIVKPLWKSHKAEEYAVDL